MSTDEDFASAMPIDGRLQFDLVDAAPGGEPGLPLKMRIQLSAHEGVYDDRAWGFCLGLNMADHPADVTLRPPAPGYDARLELDMRIVADLWSRPGHARYVVDLKHDDGRLSGEYTGECMGQTVAGRVVGRLLPHRPIRAGYAPVGRGEHPRLLVRRDQLASLKADLKAGGARAARVERLLPSDAQRRAGTIEGIDDIIAFGLQHHLKGDQRAADLLADFTRERMRQGATRMLGLSALVMEVAIAYDFAANAWDDRMRSEVTAFLERMSKLMITGGGSGWNPTPWSNWQCKARTAAGLASLAILNDPGPFPPRPAIEEVIDLAPSLDEAPPRTTPVTSFLAPPPADLPDYEGEPQIPLRDALAPSRWIWAGSVPGEGVADALAPIGGRKDALPTAGTTFTFRDRQMAFAPIPQRHLTDSPAGLVVDVIELAPGKGSRVIYLFTVLQNDRERIVRARFPGARLGAPINTLTWVAGQRVMPDQLLRLQPGYYPVMSQVAIGKLPPFVKIKWRAPVFEAAVDPGEAIIAWGQAHREYVANDRTVVSAPRMTNLARMGVERWINLALGDHGWNTEGEGYTQWVLSTLQPYLHAHYNVTGENLVANTRAEWAVLIYTMRSLFAESQTFFSVFGANQGGRMDRADLLIAHMPLMADRTRGVAQWHLEQLRRIARDRGEPAPRGGRFAQLLAILHDLESVEPVQPSHVLPRVMRDAQKGAYIFRNGWGGDSDIVATIFHQSQPRRASWGSPAGGSFRIAGFGRKWAVIGPSAEKVPPRAVENVIDVREPMSVWLGGQEVSFRAWEDGSGSVTQQMDDLYKPGPADENLVTWGLEVRRHALEDQGIRHDRAFAADYTGRSGAPGLFVVVDDITGAGPREWRMFTPHGREPLPVAIEGNTFTVRDGEASLRGVVISDGQLTLKHEDHAVRATSAGGFFVIMTLQRGAAPEARIDGDGLDAVVTVGGVDGQRISYDREARRINLHRNEPPARAITGSPPSRPDASPATAPSIPSAQD